MDVRLEGSHDKGREIRLRLAATKTMAAVLILENSCSIVSTVDSREAVRDKLFG